VPICCTPVLTDTGVRTDETSFGSTPVSCARIAASYEPYPSELGSLMLTLIVLRKSNLYSKRSVTNGNVLLSSAPKRR